MLLVSRVLSLTTDLLLIAIFETAAKRARGSNESAAEQEQAGRFGNIIRGRKSAHTPLVNIREGRPVQALNRDAVDYRAFGSLNTKEVLSVGANREDLVEHLPARQGVINRELNRCRRWQAVRHVNVQNQFGECCSVFKLNGRIRKRCVACSADKHCLAAADAQVAVAGS